MSSIDIFKDTINECFGYTEVKWRNRNFLVDFKNKESLQKLLDIVGDNNNIKFVPIKVDIVNLITSYTGKRNLNDAIKTFPDKILDITQYGKMNEYIENFSLDMNIPLFKESDNIILFRRDQFEIKDIGYRKVLKYIGHPRRPEKPINMLSMGSVILDNKRKGLDISHW